MVLPRWANRWLHYALSLLFTGLALWSAFDLLYGLFWGSFSTAWVPTTAEVVSVNHPTCGSCSRLGCHLNVSFYYDVGSHTYISDKFDLGGASLGRSFKEAQAMMNPLTVGKTIPIYYAKNHPSLGVINTQNHPGGNLLDMVVYLILAGIIHWDGRRISLDSH